MQIMQKMQNMQNMKNMSPLFLSSKEQKTEISESQSSINSRTCLDHLVLFSSAYVWTSFIVFLGALSWSANFASQKVRLTTFYLCVWWQGKYQKEYFAKVIHIWRLRRNWPFKYSLLILASKKVICNDVTNERLVCRKLDCKLQLFYRTPALSEAHPFTPCQLKMSTSLLWWHRCWCWCWRWSLLKVYKLISGWSFEAEV